MRIPPALDEFCTWLQRTELSVTIQSHAWVIPAVQSVHILSIGAVTVSSLIIALRLFGRSYGDRSTHEVSRTFLSTIWWALPVLLVSGLLMIIAEPARSLENPIFFIKMGLLLVAVGSTLGYQAPLGKNPTFWDASGWRRVVGRAWTLTSLALWIGVTFSGRWIAYIEAL
jgi:uncharacterized protein DUF6644